MDDVWLKVMADMEERRKKGLTQYGVPVKAGEDLESVLYWLNHKYEELLDAAVYTKAAIESIENTIRKGET